MPRVSPLRLAMLAFAAILIATPVAAQEVDAKGEKEVTALGQKVDRDSAAADSRDVTGKIVAQWKGTQFKFDTSAPRELTAHDVQSLRLKRFGYGEISILLALTARQPDPTKARSLNEILAMRQGGEGWGKVARNLGYASLGAVKASVKTTQARVGRVAASARAEKASGLGRSAKSDRAEKVDRPERTRIDQPERADKPGR